jgi:hypothetical protein
VHGDAAQAERVGEAPQEVIGSQAPATQMAWPSRLNSWVTFEKQNARPVPVPVRANS